MIRINTNFLADPLPDRLPLFAPGHLVKHRRYGYRGVIVAVDGHCKADPSWYFSNKTQPDRKQPWYHVLVDGTAECTYPAEENLEMDPSGLPVTHPLVPVYFSRFEHGRYVRNDAEWPGQ
jgi:heat shock protein HspQ